MATTTAIADSAPAAPTAPDDAASLSRAVAQGDTAAFGELYERYFDRACARVASLTKRDEAFCLDVVQDAMLKTARALRPMESRRSLEAWLDRVLHTTALDHLRREQRRARRELARDTSAPSTRFRDFDATTDRIIWIRERLQSLDADERSLLSLRFALDRSLEAVGGALNITGHAAHGRIRRILTRLKSEAEAHDHE